MLLGLRTKIAEWLAPEQSLSLSVKEREIDNEVGRRVAEHIARLDPLEMVMREHHAIFSSTFERVEERLNDQGQHGMMAWAWAQSRDQHFERMLDWIIDSQANETFIHTPTSVGVTADRLLLYGKAQVLSVLLLKKEVGRLASLYQEKLDRDKNGDFNNELTVE